MLKTCVLALLLVAVGASPQEDGKRTQGRFYINLSDIPILGHFFAQQSGNETASNKTTTLKHLQFYPILPSLVATSGGQLSADVAETDGKANCGQHNIHYHPHSGAHVEGAQKVTTAAPVDGIILDSIIQSKPEKVSTHLKPNKGSAVNTLLNPSLSLVQPDVAPHHNTVTPAPVDDQKQPAFVFQNPFSPNKESSQGQVPSSTSVPEVSSAVSAEKPGFFEIFHATEASQTTSATTKRPSDSYWSESFVTPSYPVMPGYPKPPAAPQNPHIPAQQSPVNSPQYPFFPTGQWPGAIQMPGAFGIPEGAVNLPAGIFQYPPQFLQIAQTQLPTTEAQGHNEPFVKFWPAKQPQQLQPTPHNNQVSSDKGNQQHTETPQTSQQTGSPQDHQIHQSAYGQQNWQQGFPYMSYPQLMANSQGSVNFAASLQHMTPTQEQDVASHSKPQLQRFPQNFKSIYAPMPLLLQRL